MSYFGLTAHTGPSKPPSISRFQTIAPVLPSRFEAPITAMDFGRNNASRLRTVTGAPRMSGCAIEARDFIRIGDARGAVGRVRRRRRGSSDVSACYRPNGALADSTVAQARHASAHSRPAHHVESPPRLAARLFGCGGASGAPLFRASVKKAHAGVTEKNDETEGRVMRRLPSLIALRCFEETARHMSFNRAAVALCVPQ